MKKQTKILYVADMVFRKSGEKPPHWGWYPYTAGAGHVGKYLGPRGTCIMIASQNDCVAPVHRWTAFITFFMHWL